MNSTNIKHYPKGLNPYSKLGHERTPFLPLEGEKVEIAAIIDADAQEQCELLVNTEGKETVFMPVSIAEAKDGKRLVKFLIGPYKLGQRILYQICYGNERTKVFSFETVKEYEVSIINIKQLESGCYKLQTDFQLLPEFFIGALNEGLKISAYPFFPENDGASFQLKDLLHAGKDYLDLVNGDRPLLSKLSMKAVAGNRLYEVKLSYLSEYQAVYGLGERFNKVNQKGMKPKNVVFEKFTMQDDKTYFPIPLYHADNGHGVYVDTFGEIDYDFSENNQISLSMVVASKKSMPDIYVFLGDIKKIIQNYTKLTGKAKLPPKWSFGLWVSANRWNCQKHIEEQLEEMDRIGYPATVLVIEAWSDEATFYIWNGAEYEVQSGEEALKLGDFTYPKEGPWPNPVGMIQELHDRGIRLVLWQIPVLKKLDEGQFSTQHDRDCEYATESGFVAANPGGSPFRIPDFWFGGSLLPDFSNPEAANWWFNKRDYLLKMGVDGFKTDGGEFVYEPEAVFYNGITGEEMKNQYPAQYIDAYNSFVGNQRVLFSRAGYKGSQCAPIHWAGDQLSTWSELRAVLKAGLSAGLSGVPFWSFDIGGFAGPLPTPELYLRATAMACFTPVMQWHSEPAGGQFEALLPGSGGINDRSPWNLARINQNPEIIDISLYYANLRMNLLPTLYSLAIQSVNSSLPMMRHMILDYPDDALVLDRDDQYLMGGLLVAPILLEGNSRREVYLPEGEWTDIWNGRGHDGNTTVIAEAGLKEIPLFLRSGEALALNLNESLQLGESVGNRVDAYTNLCFLVAGKKGCYYFYDDEGLTIELEWGNGNITLNANTKSIQITVLAFEPLASQMPADKISFNQAEVYVYQLQ